MKETALFTNPWIYDFSAYNLWVKPVGLLRVANHMRGEGYNVKFFDCLNSLSREDSFGCGKYSKKKIDKPKILKDIPRPFLRYGVPKEALEEYINNLDQPEVVYVSTGMTYWYLGAQEVIRIIRRKWPQVKIIIGGIYSILCKDHALKNLEIDSVWEGERLFCYPAWDLMGSTDSVVIQTSYGCPFDCSYCGSKILCKKFIQRPYKEVVDEVEYFINKLSVNDISFYDDALMVNRDYHIKPFLREIINRNIKVRFHLPNAIHARLIDSEIVKLMRKAGFTTIRLGLETSKDKRRDSKVTNEELIQAVSYLKEAGFQMKDIGVYTMFGSIEDNYDDVIKDIEFVTGTVKVPIKITAYSLVPGTDDFKKWGFSDSMDPLLHNKVVFPLLYGGYNTDMIEKLRKHASLKNKELIS